MRTAAEIDEAARLRWEKRLGRPVSAEEAAEFRGVLVRLVLALARVPPPADPPPIHDTEDGESGPRPRPREKS